MADVMISQSIFMAISGSDVSTIADRSESDVIRIKNSSRAWLDHSMDGHVSGHKYRGMIRNFSFNYICLKD